MDGGTLNNVYDTSRGIEPSGCMDLDNVLDYTSCWKILRGAAFVSALSARLESTTSVPPSGEGRAPDVHATVSGASTDNRPRNSRNMWRRTSEWKLEARLR